MAREETASQMQENQGDTNQQLELSVGAEQAKEEEEDEREDD